MIFTNTEHDQGNIIATIERLAQQGSAFTLTRFYRGLLLSQEVRILTVLQNSATFRTYNVTRLAPSEEGCFQLHHPVLDRPVRACLRHCSFDNNTFVLSDFAYLSRKWKERSHDRVQPQIPTIISLRCELLRIHAICSDISVKGMGVLAQRSPRLAAQLVVGKGILIDSPFFLEYRGKRLKGTVVSLSPVGPLLVRIGIQVDPDSNQALRLERYVAQRKEEIMGELGRAYLRALEPRRVEDLFF